ncbi:MAG TPA: serine/threonine-protein kinase, partial [Chroococcales cyanobacterium]
MPLHDSFKRRGKTNIVKLSAPPTAEDLAYGMAQATQPRSEPVGFGWTACGDDRVLYIVRGYGGAEVNWILRAGEQPDSPMVWRYSTTDYQMIYTLLAEEHAPPEPAAVIPEYLRPKPPEEEAEDPEATETTGSSSSNSDGLAGEDGDESAIGTVFAERYEIIEKVGKGAMGTVYKARQKLIDRFVALKVLHRHLVTDEMHRRRFNQEAKASSTLKHPNLITVYDFGFGINNRPFIAMEFIEGPTLHDLLDQTATLPLDGFLAIFSQCCLGLSSAHHSGVIHRDLKPSNIVLTTNADDTLTVKIVDFGLAKVIAGARDQNLTGSGAVVGSPYFMSPEQCR